MHCFLWLNAIYYFIGSGLVHWFKIFFFFYQILTQVVFIVTLFLCSVAYWILITDQVRRSNLQSVPCTGTGKDFVVTKNVTTTTLFWYFHYT